MEFDREKKFICNILNNFVRLNFKNLTAKLIIFISKLFMWKSVVDLINMIKFKLKNRFEYFIYFYIWQIIIGS